MAVCKEASAPPASSRTFDELKDSFMKRESAIPELNSHISDCKAKLACLSEWFRSFIEEVRNVCRCGSISRMSSFRTELHAFFKAYGRSRSYGNSLREAIKLARNCYSRFEKHRNELASLLLAKTREVNENKVNTEHDSLQSGVSAGISICSSAADVFSSWCTGGLLNVAQYVRTSEGSSIKNVVFNAVNFWQCRKQSNEFAEIEKDFEDIHKVVDEAREIAVSFMEKLNSLESQITFLEQSHGRQAVKRRLRSIQCDHLAYIRQRTESISPKLLEWNAIP